MRKFTTLISYAAMLFTTACAQTGLFAANLPTRFDDIQIIRNISYGALPEQTLDIYLPVSPTKQKHDVVVFFYGGRWETGQKEQYRFVGSALAKQGFIVVIPDYRKYPIVKFPAFVQDGAKATAWTFDHIGQYGGDHNRINLAGHSSGAHIAALLTADKKYLKAEGRERSDVIHSFAGLAGPYDFTPEEDDLKDMFGPPSNYPNMRPTTFIDGKQPPMLLLYGADDKTVGKFNLENLAARIHKKGGCVETTIYPDTDHVWIVAALSWLGKTKAPVIEDMTRFFKAKNCAPK